MKTINDLRSITLTPATPPPKTAPTGLLARFSSWDYDTFQVAWSQKTETDLPAALRDCRDQLVILCSKFQTQEGVPKKTAQEVQHYVSLVDETINGVTQPLSSAPIEKRRQLGYAVEVFHRALDAAQAGQMTPEQSSTLDAAWRAQYTAGSPHYMWLAAGCEALAGVIGIGGQVANYILRNDEKSTEYNALQIASMVGGPTFAVLGMGLGCYAQYRKRQAPPTPGTVLGALDQAMRQLHAVQSAEARKRCCCCCWV